MSRKSLETLVQPVAVCSLQSLAVSRPASEFFQTHSSPRGGSRPQPEDGSSIDQNIAFGHGHSLLIDLHERNCSSTAMDYLTPARALQRIVAPGAVAFVQASKIE